MSFDFLQYYCHITCLLNTCCSCFLWVYIQERCCRTVLPVKVNRYQRLNWVNESVSKGPRYTKSSFQVKSAADAGSSYQSCCGQSVKKWWHPVHSTLFSFLQLVELRANCRKRSVKLWVFWKTSITACISNICPVLHLKKWHTLEKQCFERRNICSSSETRFPPYLQKNLFGFNIFCCHWIMNICSNLFLCKHLGKVDVLGNDE